jgi:hypothetical protein
VNIYFAWKPDSLQFDSNEAVDEGEVQDPSAKRAKKGKKTGKTSRPALGSPERRTRAVGVWMRSQAQLEEAEAEWGLVMKRKHGEDDEVVVKEEEGIDDELDFDLPDIIHIINGRS